MQINQATDYAFRVVSYFSSLPPETIVTAKRLSEQEKIPMRFLLKIMRILVKKDIVKSFRGIEGGYALARPPAAISLLDVIEAVEGPITLNPCLADQNSCNKNQTHLCPVHPILKEIQKKLTDEFRQYNFADLSWPKTGQSQINIPLI